jgi:hypothetical protein
VRARWFMCASARMRSTAVIDGRKLGVGGERPLWTAVGLDVCLHAGAHYSAVVVGCSGAADNIKEQKSALTEFWKTYSYIDISHAQHAQFLQALGELEVIRDQANDKWSMHSSTIKYAGRVL